MGKSTTSAGEKKHRTPTINPSAWKSDSPEELHFLLSCPLLSAPRGHAAGGWAGQSRGAVLRALTHPSWAAAPPPPTLGAFPEPFPALLSFGTFSIQLSPQSHPFSGRWVQPRQQSPSSSQPRSRKPPPHPPSLGVSSPLTEVPPLPGPVPTRKKNLFSTVGCIRCQATSSAPHLSWIRLLRRSRLSYFFKPGPARFDFLTRARSHLPHCSIAAIPGCPGPEHPQPPRDGHRARPGPNRAGFPSGLARALWDLCRPG